MSCAHLLPNPEAASAFGLQCNDALNFLPLCGVMGRLATCHDALDKHLMCFMHVPLRDGGATTTPMTSAMEPPGICLKAAVRGQCVPAVDIGIMRLSTKAFPARLSFPKVHPCPIAA